MNVLNMLIGFCLHEIVAVNCLELGRRAIEIFHPIRGKPVNVNNWGSSKTIYYTTDLNLKGFTWELIELYLRDKVTFSWTHGYLAVLTAFQ